MHEIQQLTFGLCEYVSVTIGNPAFCLALYLTGVLFQGEFQHVGDVSEQNIKCQPIKTRETGGVRLSDCNICFILRLHFSFSNTITIFKFNHYIHTCSITVIFLP